MRDDNNGYHGVLQKETPEGLSPSEETSGMQTSQKVLSL